MNTREYVATLISNAPALADLGLPVDNVFDADTADSPDVKPFIVLRWGQEIAGLGRMRRFPLDIWVYDNSGDHSRAAAIADATAFLLKSLVPVQVNDNGWMTHIDISGGLYGRGGDLRDDGFDALVVPYRTLVTTTAG